LVAMKVTVVALLVAATAIMAIKFVYDNVF